MLFHWSLFDVQFDIIILDYLVQYRTSGIFLTSDCLKCLFFSFFRSKSLCVQVIALKFHEFSDENKML